MLEKEHQTCSRNIRKRKDLCKQTGATSINFPDKKRSKREANEANGRVGSWQKAERAVAFTRTASYVSF